MAANGYLPDSDLRPIAGEGQLEPAAAAAWNGMAAYIFDKTGVKIAPNGPDSSYRSFDRQQYWKEYWCSRGACENAATPGTSNHGIGLAVDTDDSAIVNEYGADFGWQKAWSDAPQEAWHFKYATGHYDGPDPGPDYDATDPRLDKWRMRIDAARKVKGQKTKRLRGIERQVKKLDARIKRWRARANRRNEGG